MCSELANVILEFNQSLGIQLAQGADYSIFFRGGPIIQHVAKGILPKRVLAWPGSGNRVKDTAYLLHQVPSGRRVVWILVVCFDAIPAYRRLTEGACACICLLPCCLWRINEALERHFSEPCRIYGALHDLRRKSNVTTLPSIPQHFGFNRSCVRSLVQAQVRHSHS